MRRLIAAIAFLALLALLAVAGWRWLVDAYTAPGPAEAAVTIIVPKGAHLSEIAAQAAKGGAVKSAWVLMAEAALAHNPSLKAGEYAFPPHAGMAAILDMMHRGQVVEHRLTVAEGLTAKQIIALVGKADALRGGLLAVPKEGTLLPQTYFYVYDDPRDLLIERMTGAMTQTLDTLWANRAPDLPFDTKEQAVTLASIVERETALAAERPHVAAVYENRLKLKMKLESDPTVIYAVSNGEGVLDRPISRADLASTSPYNTYQFDGLPPGPICNPGKASIEAVLHPTASDDLYFVADGSGGHAFARTLAQHNKNVEHWRQVEKSQGTGKGG